MKKILFIIFTILMILNVTSFAKDTSTINGSSYLNNGEYDSLNVNGNIEFKDLFIKNSIVINGSVQGENLKCYTINSNGSADINGLRAQRVEINGSFLGQNIDVSGNAKFNGGVKIKTGKFHDIQIASTNSTIIDTKVNGSIRVKKINKGWNFFSVKCNESSTQVLELKGYTVVSGDIVFEEDGEVHIFDEARVEGKIIKAKIIQK